MYLRLLEYGLRRVAIYSIDLSIPVRQFLPPIINLAEIYVNIPQVGPINRKMVFASGPRSRLRVQRGIQAAICVKKTSVLYA